MSSVITWVLTDPEMIADILGNNEDSTMKQPEPVTANGKLEYALHCAILNQIDKVDASAHGLEFMQEDYILQQQCEAYVDIFGVLPADIAQALAK